MDIKVVYCTKSGHSRKIANAFSTALGTEAVNLKEEQPKKADVLFIVSGIYGGVCAPELAEYAGTLDKESIGKVVLMTSSGSGKGTQKDVRKTLEDKSVAVVEEEFTCRGSILFVGMGHPNAKDIDEAVEFAKKQAGN